MRMDQAVILARGLGTRMRRADAEAALDERQRAVAETGVKALIPIGRPFLDYVLSGLADAGYRRVCLVVAPEHEALREYYHRQVQPRRVRIEFAVQAEPRGTADAVAAAEAFASGGDFLVLNSDNYYPQEALRALRELADGPGHFAAALFERAALIAASNIPADRVRQFAVGNFDERGYLRRILEKPDEAMLAAMPRPLWVSMNCWRFGPEIFEACRRIGPSPRGELELTDAVQHVIEVLERPIRVVQVRAGVLDLTSRRDVETIRPRLSGIEVQL
jgi:glucose-1-phosphate thymidylyltransferase